MKNSVFRVSESVRTMSLERVTDLESSVTSVTSEEEQSLVAASDGGSTTFCDATNEYDCDDAKDDDYHLTLTLLNNMKNRGGAMGHGLGIAGSLGDDSSGLGLETPSGSATGSADSFSSEADVDACERTPLRPADAADVILQATGKPSLKLTKKQKSYDSEGGAYRKSSRSSRSSCSRSSSSGRYSGDLEAAAAAPKKSKVPDGGWGWVVVASSFVLSMIADGISFSFGLLFLQFKDHFDESATKISWIGSLFMSVPLMSGPLGSALVDRFGCRSMTIVGGLISAFGFVLSAFADSVEMLLITFGVIASLGLGLCYVTCVVSIAYWFDKKRAFATGLAAAGTGFGTFVFAPLTQFFITEYGWRGAILMLAGTFLQMCVCGAVMRDPDWWVEEQNKSASAGAAAGAGSVSNRSHKDSSCGSISHHDTINAGHVSAAATVAELERVRALLKSGRSPEYVLTALAAGATPPGDGTVTTVAKHHPNTSASVVNLPTFVRQNETVPLEVLEALSANKRVFHVVLESYPGLFPGRSISDHGPLGFAIGNPGAATANAVVAVSTPPDTPSLCRGDAGTPRSPLTMSMRVRPKSHSPTPPMALPRNGTAQSLSGALKPNGGTPPPLLAPNALTAPTRPLPPPALVKQRQLCGVAQASNYLKGIRMHRNSVMYRGAMLNIQKYKLRASSCPDIYRNSMTTIAQENEERWYSSVVSLLRGMSDFSLFAELHFMLFQMSTVLLFIWFIVPYFYLAEHMTDRGYTEERASQLLGIIGITNTIGIVVLGWAGDHPAVNVAKTYALCLVACGIAALAIAPTTGNFLGLSVSSGFFGLFFASSFSFTPVILVQLIPLERFTQAYGLVLLCQGIGNLIGPPIGALCFDITKTWDLSLYLSGVWIIVSGLLIAVIPLTTNRRMWGSGPTVKEKELEQVSCA